MTDIEIYSILISIKQNEMRVPDKHRRRLVEGGYIKAETPSLSVYEDSNVWWGYVFTDKALSLISKLG